MEPADRDKSTAKHDRPCIWMQAGVVKRKHCAIDYQCPACRFDKALQKAAAANHKISGGAEAARAGGGGIVSWRDKLMERPVRQRPCIHSMKDRIDFRSCTHDYRCGDCEFDQYFDDQYTVHAVVRPVAALEIAGFKIPQGVYLHPGHAWAKIEEGSTVRIGLDDFAFKILGPLDGIQPPLVGKEIRRGRSDIALSRGAMSAGFQSPVSGVVTDVNHNLRENMHPAQDDPYGCGWVLRVHAPDLRQDLKHLMIVDQTRDFMETEVDRLYDEIEAVAGPLAADGGILAHDICSRLPGLDWRHLAATFLRSR